MKKFKNFLQETNNSNIFYRGIEGEYNPDLDKNSKLIWITQNKKYAEVYTDGQDAIKYKTNIKNSFDFNYRTLKVDVKLKDLFKKIQLQLMDDFGNNKISKDKAMKLDDELDDIVSNYKSIENKFKEVWQWYMSIKEIPEILTKMGYDSIIGNEGNNNDITTYGVFGSKFLKKVN